MALFPAVNGFWRKALRRAAPVLAAAALAAFPARGGDADAGKADAITSASIDATTGATRQLEPIKVTDSFSVAYAVNDDGALFIRADDLADAYGRDELASDSLFKGRTMVVRGDVERMSKPDAAKAWIVLGGGASGKKVRCALAKGGPAGKNVKPGDTVQVRGVCEGMKLNVSIVKGEIIE